ncbi:hypothetical protein NDU88_005523 [Pleurodeles waltl]|uniref:Uncharacterized protein n=1 Tax=Pleurodeles waltl TaxID=8319 RepID=A0AAV7LUB7_PLEWA|nr:hypothetical protein NDU88_005523 [Pleurodeles waltl]
MSPGRRAPPGAMLCYQVRPMPETTEDTRCQALQEMQGYNRDKTCQEEPRWASRPWSHAGQPMPKGTGQSYQEPQRATDVRGRAKDGMPAPVLKSLSVSLRERAVGTARSALITSRIKKISLLVPPVPGQRFVKMTGEVVLLRKQPEDLASNLSFSLPRCELRCVILSKTL